jgi:hypothetical protein
VKIEVTPRELEEQAGHIWNNALIAVSHAVREHPRLDEDTKLDVLNAVQGLKR